MQSEGGKKVCFLYHPILSPLFVHHQANSPTHALLKQPLYIVGNKYTIADICIFSWVNWAEWAGISLEPYPHVKAWLQNIQERPAVEKGVNVPDKFEMKEAMKTKEGEEEYAKHHSNWVIAGQNEDAKRHQ